MTDLAPIGPTVVATPYSIKNLPPLIIGGAVFNTQYTSNPQSLPIAQVLHKAFELGLNAIDTSPYYGPSEELLGNALKSLLFTRDQYYICTKAGRIKLNEFDYSRANVRASVARSLQRLGTSYLDLVYMHDIEFVEAPQIYEALKELKKLKQEGLIKNFGVSGYPVDYLYEIALGSYQDPEIGALDAILSYSNGCIQNVSLFDYYDKFHKECGIGKLMNGSILSMSLLRSGSTLSFHPAAQTLKDKVAEVAQYLESQHQVELADLATRFALKKWLFDSAVQPEDSEEHEWNAVTSTVLGVSSIRELDVAISSYWQVKRNIGGINEKDELLFQKVKELLGDHFNEVWPSGIDRS
ncbi:D-threo-aldose 1-dehydrogenase [Suhomyces tanzawaensis NRRL Y-17324]|uniref:D-threo-aldose 1-dehydrogenase n=1 Tax=Suhomyces tanzawaensis NRRL Y-17324 TaxID=984487 RepID=A0A1E4SDU7_9ASCO|nr:D-threo-aldose 1-dehydrogenase [Suhomyces tanzawaensis NRRL Y-17324]ODV77689.1 D-threo-aldose 1-dehydrogenase [Suhomyces tanzawaensis NRRL Y-17324]